MATFRMPPPPPKLVVEPPEPPWQSGGTGSDVLFQISGIEALAATLRSMPKVYRDAAGYEMANIAHEVVDDAKDNYVPFRFGGLKDSGDADEYDPNGSGVDITQIAMWFGGPAAVSVSDVSVHSIASKQHRAIHSEGLHIVDPSLYALAQHEDLSYHHHPPPDQTGPKYLERPLIKIQDTIVPRIAKAAGIALGTDLGVLESDLRGMPSYPGYGPKDASGAPKFGKSGPAAGATK